MSRLLGHGPYTFEVPPRGVAPASFLGQKKEPLPPGGDAGGWGPGAWELVLSTFKSMVSFLNVNHDHVLPPNCYQDI